jgi:hypothetical protein
MDARSHAICARVALMRNQALDFNAQHEVDLEIANARIVELEARVKELEAQLPAKE